MAQVLPALGDGSFSHAPLRTSASHTSFFDSTGHYRSPRKTNYSFSDLTSPALSYSSQTSSTQSTQSTQSTSASSLSLETKFDDSSSDDEGLAFPAYFAAENFNEEEASQVPPSSPIRSTRAPAPSPADAQVSPRELLPISEDDTAVRPEPSQHVDYLSHEWKEEDIWASWRHIVEHRSVYGERSRLENASWRTWAKTQFQLGTVSPETLNWMKDVDVTWLYGPLQPASNRNFSHQTSEPVSRLSKSNSFLHKKPILKKRSMSEVMLAKSLSSSSLVKQAAAAVQAQQAGGPFLERRRSRPIIGRAASDFGYLSSTRTTSRDPTDYFSSKDTSGLQTPSDSGKKHIRFDEKVEQCIAVDVKGADEDDEEDFNHNPWAKYRDDDSSSDEGVVMMKRSRKKRPLSRTNSKTSISGESKTIAKLPSTTLKYRTDSPDIADQTPTHSLGFWRSSRLSPSPSQETLRPSNPSTNFLLPDDDDEEEEPFTFNASRAYEGKRSSSSNLTKRPSTPGLAPESSEAGGMRRTASGMFMPFEDEDENPQQPGIIGRVVDTVNTARDIAHVIWNVGWRN